MKTNLEQAYEKESARVAYDTVGRWGHDTLVASAEYADWLEKKNTELAMAVINLISHAGYTFEQSRNYYEDVMEAQAILKSIGVEI